MKEKRSKNRKVLIIGGGIAGLSAAIALEQQGVHTEVYEAQAVNKVAGAGIWVATNAMQVFARLGLADSIIENGAPLELVAVADHRLNILQTLEQGYFAERFGYPITSLLRSKLRDQLLRHYGKPVFLDKRLSSVQQDADTVEAYFSDGSSARGDLLLGADGIHSQVRPHVVANSEIRYSGQTCWRGVAQIQLAPPWQKSCVETWGKTGRLGFSVVSDQEVYWFAVMKAPRGERDVLPGIKQKLQTHFADFAAPIPAILAATQEERIIRNDITDLKALSTWHRGRVCLIGDAAHATTPNMGQGGGQAIEDAWFMAQAIGQFAEPGEAFRYFEKKRRPKVQQVVDTSWQIGKMAHITYGRGLRNWILRNTPERMMLKRMEKLYSIDY